MGKRVVLQHLGRLDGLFAREASPSSDLPLPVKTVENPQTPVHLVERTHQLIRHEHRRIGLVVVEELAERSSDDLARLRVVDQPSTLLCDLVPVTVTLSLSRVIRNHNIRMSRVILQSHITLFNHLVEKRQVKQVSDLHEVSLVTVNSWEVVLLVSVWSQLPVACLFKLSHKLCLEVLHFLVRTSQIMPRLRKKLILNILRSNTFREKLVAIILPS